MFIKINYIDGKDKERIIIENKNLFLIEDAKLLTENYLVFSDKRYITEAEELENKIFNLELENQSLKEELTLTQDAVNELLFSVMNMQLI